MPGEGSDGGMSSEEDIDEDNQGPAAKPKRKLGDKVPPKKRASHFDTKAETVVGKVVARCKFAPGSTTEAYPLPSAGTGSYLGPGSGWMSPSLLCV